MEICKIENCTGCFACKNICPKDAISSITNELGKTIPLIDEIICIKCGACKNVCPVNNPVKSQIPKSIYAAWSKNDNDILSSSSGGIASVYARSFIKDGGVVFGAASHEKTVNHIAALSESAIEQIRGSKYVQSDIGYIFRQIKEYINSKKQVLFIGTPCQVAGLKNFLHNDPKDLITIDLICHGTPPSTYLKEHINYVIKGHKTWDTVSFRGKYNYILTAYDKNRIVYQKHANEDTYFRAFLDGLSYRDNCYTCSYASSKRIADITLADFWGIDRNTLKNQYDGRISLIMINTDKGAAFFEKNKDKIIWEERTLSEAMSPEQTNLHHASDMHKDRKIFESNYIKYGFEKAVNKTEIGKRIRKKHFEKFFGFYAIKKVLRKIKNILKRIKSV